MGTQGAVFNLVLRDDRYDQWFTAADFLRKRLDEIRKQRAARGESNVQPTFADLERSHLVYVHSVYRPYVSTASEYVRVKPHGDAVSFLSASGGSLQFNFQTYGHFASDSALHVRFRAVMAPGADLPGAVPSAATPLLRYCAYPGLRLPLRTALHSDSVLIDDYSRDDAVAWTKFFVHADQRTGWERCLGQQDLREATFYANGFTESLFYRDGPQTPRLVQPAFDMFIPLQFWYCRDAANALLNDLIPNTQRTITVELAPLADILEALVPDPQNPGGLLPTPLPPGLTRLAMDVELYTNNLYVNPEIHDIFASRIGFGLIRVHRRQVNQLTGTADRFLLDQLKFPAEYLMVGLRARAQAADFDRWWLMGALTPRAPTDQLLVPALIWNTALQVAQLVSRTATEATTLDNFTECLGVTAHGVEIYPKLPSAFYNAYLPIRYAEGAYNVSPVDSSMFLVNFCLYPGRFNPSGYYNLSAGRELYISYEIKSSYAGLLLPGKAEMVTSMSALNFLVRKGDRISLKYAV